MNTDNFIERANRNLDRIDNELCALEAKVEDYGKQGDRWAADQARKLRADVETARAEVSAIADRADREVTEQLEDSKADAERHWEALKAAVKAYRDHVGASL